MELITDRNKGYKWFVNDMGAIRGYIQIKDGTVLREFEAVRYFSDVDNLKSFAEKLQTVDGRFSIIITHNKKTYAAVDIMRSMPIYFDEELCYLADNAESIRKELGIEKSEIEELRTIELYCSTFVSYNNTIYKKIKQLDCSEAIEISEEGYRIIRYYERDTNIFFEGRKDILEKLDTVTNNMVSRIKEVVGNRPVLLSLSAGYDSRFIACALKQNGIENVTCYSYGRKDSFEPVKSKEIAEKLGYKWLGVEYLDDDNLDILKDKEFLDYCIEHDHTIYLQNYVAVKKLSQKGLIPKNAICLVGLVNDVTVGHYVPSQKVARQYGYTNKGLARYAVDYRFERFNLSKKSKKLFVAEVLEVIDKRHMSVTDYQSFVTFWDELNLGYGHSRNYPKMNKNHEFFGCEWLLPCADKELMQFWTSVPAEMRVNHNLFEEYVTEVLGKKYGVGQKKYIEEIAPTEKTRKIKRKIGGVVCRILFPLGIPIRRKADTENFAPLEVKLYKGIRQKKAVKFDRAGIRQLMDIYFMEQRYGTEWFSKIKSYFI